MLPKFRFFDRPIVRPFVHSSYSSFVHSSYSAFVHTDYSPSLFTITIHRYYPPSLLFIVTIQRHYSSSLLFIDDTYGTFSLLLFIVTIHR
jgi:hypothetical protein